MLTMWGAIRVANSQRFRDNRGGQILTVWPEESQHGDVFPLHARVAVMERPAKSRRELSVPHAPRFSAPRGRFQAQSGLAHRADKNFTTASRSCGRLTMSPRKLVSAI